MTIPLERTTSVIRTRQFLIDLSDPKKTPRIPLSVRRYAVSLLKHYPTQYEMEIIASKEDGDTTLLPKIFGNGI